MAHKLLKLSPGVETTNTPAINEAAYSSSQLIRFLPERNGLGLAQKLGGWVAYYPYSMGSTVRALKGWSDLNAVPHLAAGATSSLNVITNGTSWSVVTPQTTTTNMTPRFTTTTGATAHTVTVIDYGIITNNFSYVNYTTPVSVGGIILTGPYAIKGAVYAVNTATTGASGTGSTATITFAAQPAAVPIGSKVIISGVTPTGYNGTYTVTNSTTTSVSYANTTTGSQTVAGTAQYGSSYTITSASPATSAVSNGGSSYSFTTQSSLATVVVTLANNTYNVGDEIYVSVPTTVGGITLSGLYVVSGISVAGTSFTIIASNTASSSATASINGGLINSVYYVALGPQSNPLGFGLGGFGSGAFGTGASLNALPGTPITATDWTLDNFGSFLVACPAGGPIYYYDPSGQLQNAQYVGGNAPLVNSGIFVAMPQRQVVAYGSSFTLQADPLLIRWSDVEDSTSWIGTATNQAGSYRIPTGSTIIAGIQGSQQGLFWTDLDLWAMQYVGPPLVYGFNKISSNCGAVSRHCTGQYNNVVYWMSQKQFFMFTGQGVQPIPCPVWDVVFQNFNFSLKDLVCCGVNSQFNEVTWYYPSANATQNDSYVKYNIALNQWDFGTLSRTAWIDQSVLGSPIGAGSDYYLYQHEMGNDAASGTQTTAMQSSFQTGYFQLDEADNIMFVDQIWPDMKWGTYSGSQNATVYLTVYYTNYATDAAVSPSTSIYSGSPSNTVSTATFPMTQATEYISCRIRARYMAFALSSNDVGTFWRLGGIRYRAAPDGKY